MCTRANVSKPVNIISYGKTRYYHFIFYLFIYFPIDNHSLSVPLQYILWTSLKQHRSNAHILWSEHGDKFTKVYNKSVFCVRTTVDINSLSTVRIFKLHRSRVPSVEVKRSRCAPRCSRPFLFFLSSASYGNTSVTCLEFDFSRVLESEYIFNLALF